MKKMIPLIPMPLDKVKKIARHYVGFGESLSHMFPSLDWELDQTDLDFEAREWMGVAIFATLFYLTFIFALVFLMALAAKVAITMALSISLLSSVPFAGVSFLYISMYPKLFVRKRIKEIDRNLGFAIQQLLIHIRSGVPIFNSLVSVARADYGLLSEEFGKAVNQISTGKSEIEALEQMARSNPSFYLRRVMWQIINAMKSGADVGKTLKEITNSLAMDQRVNIKKYGSQLNPLALFYMVLVVIFPTLGIIFLLILSSFVGAMFDIQLILIGILGFLVFFQVMFMGLIKNRRPPGIE